MDQNRRNVGHSRDRSQASMNSKDSKKPVSGILSSSIVKAARFLHPQQAPPRMKNIYKTNLDKCTNETKDAEEYVQRIQEGLKKAKTNR